MISEYVAPAGAKGLSLMDLYSKPIAIELSTSAHRFGIGRNGGRATPTSGVPSTMLSNQTLAQE